MLMNDGNGEFLHFQKSLSARDIDIKKLLLPKKNLVLNQSILYRCYIPKTAGTC